MADKTLISNYDGTLVKVGDRLRRVDKGAAVPAGADVDHVKLLLDRGMVSKGEPVGGIDVDPDAAPPFTVPAGDTGGGRSSSYDGTAAPSKSGSKADWFDWACRVEGVTADSDEGKVLDAMTRNQLADLYADRTPAPAGA